MARPGAGGEPMRRRPSATFVNLLVLVAPAVAAAAFTLTLAAQSLARRQDVALSGRLPRPWPSLPDTPHAAGSPSASAGRAIVLCLLSGWPASPAGRSRAASRMAFALQGLALLHAATRGAGRARASSLMTYVLTLFFGGTVLPVLALAGMVDTRLAPPAPPVRDRRRPTPRPPDRSRRRPWK